MDFWGPAASFWLWGDFVRWLFRLHGLFGRRRDWLLGGVLGLFAWHFVLFLSYVRYKTH